MFFVLRSGRTVAAVLVSALFLPTFAFSQTTIYQWDFNTKGTGSTVGAGGTASPIGGVTATFVGGNDGGTGTIAAGSSDPGSGANSANFVWRTTNYTGASGTSGARFAGVNTSGMTNLLFAFDLTAVDRGQPTPPTGSRWYQVRYSSDGTNFTNLGGPLEYQRTLGGEASLWAQENVLSLAGVAPAANMRFELVAIHAPGTTSYAPAQSGTTFSASAPVFLDMVSVYQGNTWSSTAGSGDLQTGSNWSHGAPATSPTAAIPLSAYVMFGGNENASVTVNNANGGASFSLGSISFTTEANSTAYTLTGDPINLGKRESGQATLLAGAATLTNASNKQQTISTGLTLSSSQVWDSGPTANGGSLLVNGPALILSSGMSLTVAGENQTTISAPFFFLGNSSLTKTGGGTLTIPTANTNAFGGAVQVNVNGGSLAVTNAAGSATADAAIQVNSGGKLTGNGRVQPGFLKTVTVAGSGAISPGTGTGAANRALTIAAGGLTIQAGGIYEVNIFGSGINDTGLLNVTGGVSTPATGTGIKVNLRLDGVDRDTLRAAVGLGNTRVYTLTNVSAASNWNVTANNFTDLGFSATEWVPGQSGNNLTLTFKPVPDARFALAVAGAGLLALAAVRRRTRLAARTVSAA